MGLSTFLALFISVAFAQTPTPQESLRLNNAPAVMIAIAFAESGFQQFDNKGNLLCDGVTHTHCGIFQISKSYSKDALSKGFDIDTPSGNIGYALYLYSKNGTRDWNASYKDPTNPNSWGKFFDKKGKPLGGTSPPLQG